MFFSQYVLLWLFSLLPFPDKNVCFIHVRRLFDYNFYFFPRFYYFQQTFIKIIQQHSTRSVVVASGTVLPNHHCFNIKHCLGLFIHFFLISYCFRRFISRVSPFLLVRNSYQGIRWSMSHHDRSHNLRKSLSSYNSTQSDSSPPLKGRLCNTSWWPPV